MQRTHQRPKLALLAVTLVIASGAAMAADTAVSPAETAVRAAETQRFAAMIKADVPALTLLVADNLIYTHSTGVRQTKSEYIADIASGKLVYKAVAATDQHVQVFGDAAVITGGVKAVVNIGGDDRTIDLLYTDVYVKRSGRWQLLAWQSTTRPK